MKSSLRIFGVFLLTAIYYFGISTAVPSLNFSKKNQTETTTEDAYFSVASSHVSSHTVSSDLSFTSISNLGFTSLKYPSSNLWVDLQLTEKLIRTRFIQYGRFFDDFLILKRKKALIFPSHYFW